MARQNTSFLHKPSSRHHKGHVRSPKSSFILPKRSPLASAGDRGRSFGVLADSRRFSTRLRRELHPIRESDNEEADDGLPYRQFADFLDEDDGENESDGDIDMYEWDETTLYEHFLSDEIQEETERDKLISLANQLKAPFAAQQKHLKEFVLQTYAPAAKRIKDVHSALDDKIDPALTEGICTFDDACKEMEAEAITEEGDFKAAYKEFKVGKHATNTKTALEPLLQNNVKNLFTQLEQAYAHRARLWTEFEADIDHIAGPALADLKALPEKLEQVIDNCEKRSKKLDKESSATSKKNATMWELLDNM